MQEKLKLIETKTFCSDKAYLFEAVRIIGRKQVKTNEGAEINLTGVQFAQGLEVVVMILGIDGKGNVILGKKNRTIEGI